VTKVTIASPRSTSFVDYAELRFRILHSSDVADFQRLVCTSLSSL